MNQKDRIIEVTTELITENEGNVSLVTARKIADRADVGLGLINYHFGSKEQLITECVQRIITYQIKLFTPDNIKYSSNPFKADKDRLSYWALQVFEFLYANRSISSISILGDMQNNLTQSNSVITQIGFENALQSDIPAARKKMIVFTLTSTMQGAFLQDNVIKDRLGYDLSQKEDREKYIYSLVEMLFEGIK